MPSDPSKDVNRDYQTLCWPHSRLRSTTLAQESFATVQRPSISRRETTQQLVTNCQDGTGHEWVELWLDCQDSRNDG